MTNTVEIRISQLRNAADQLRRSAGRVAFSVQSAADVIDGMVALGAVPPDFQQRYIAVRGHMTEWSDTLERFSEHLTDAADDVEAAHTGQRIYPGFASGLGRGRVRPYMPERDAAPPAPLTPAPQAPLTDSVYVNRKNHALREAWQARRADLESKESALAALVDTRAAKADDLAALKNRLHSYDPATDVSEIPRVQAMQAELNRLDGQISALEGQVDALGADVDQLAARLERVTPTAGADIKLIQSLEGSTSPDYLSQNTFDCVQHIVGKFHVPGELAVDAKLWAEMAAQFPEYGVQVGDMPLEGAVLMMDPDHAYADDVYGHVMYVENVSGGEVWVTDDTYNGDPVRLSDITDETTGDKLRYLYFPWHTQG